jgi:hypothetical protein
MSTIILMLSLLWPSAPGLDLVSDSVVDDGPIRYRGIERLLASFEAKAPQNL